MPRSLEHEQHGCRRRNRLAICAAVTLSSRFPRSRKLSKDLLLLSELNCLPRTSLCAQINEVRFAAPACMCLHVRAFVCVLTVYTHSSKNLTWRDMQHLVVRTSHPAHLLANDWKTNGVQRKGTHPGSSHAPSSFEDVGNSWSDLRDGHSLLSLDPLPALLLQSATRTATVCWTPARLYRWPVPGPMLRPSGGV